MNLKAIHVAREAGVSAVTVSRVFSGKAPVAASTRTRVLEVAERLGYMPNKLASGLAGGKTRSLGLLWGFGNTYSAVNMVAELSQRFGQHNYLVNPADEVNLEQIHKHLREFSLRRVDGVVLQFLSREPMPEPLKQVLRHFPASLVVAMEPCEVPGDLIVHDRYRAFEQVAEHFASSGRRHPVILHREAINRGKVEVFIRRLRERGIVNEPAAIELRAEGSQDRLEAVQQSLERSYAAGVHFDAVACMNDEDAIAAMAWARRRGMQVPREMAVVGTNNGPAAPYLSPALGSIERHDDRLAQMIVQTMLNRLENPDLPPMREQLAMEFIHRESAGA